MMNMINNKRIIALITSLVIGCAGVSADVYAADNSAPKDDGYACINLSGSPTNTVYYGEVDAYKAVIWDVSDFSAKGNRVRLQYRLPQKIDLTDGPFTVDVSMKILGGTFAMNGFPGLADTVFGLYQWSNTDKYRLAANNSAYIANDWGKTINNFQERFNLKPDDLKNGFYTFRYVVYPHIGSDGSNGFRFYYKNDIDGHWYEPYGEYQLSDKLAQGVLPGGTLPERLEYLNFDARLLQDAAADNNLKIAFKKIEVGNGLKCVSSNVGNGGILTKPYFELAFNHAVDMSTLNDGTVSVSRDGARLSLNADYTISQSDGTTVRINFAETPSVGSRYSIVLDGINNRDYLAKLDGALSLDFTASSEKELADMYADGIFVSQSGSDGGNGTISAPFASIESAVAKWKEIGAQINIKPVIYLRGGEYRVTDSIYLDNSCSGMTISGYADETAVLNGAAKITADMVRSAHSSDCGGRLNRSAVKNIIRIDLSGIDGLYRSDSKAISDCELINNGEIQNIAAWPNKDCWDYTGKVTDNGGGTYTFVSSKNDFWDSAADDVMMEGYWYADYQFERGKVMSFDKSTGAITVSQDRDKFSSNRRYRLYNLPEEIDVPGEYYINYKEKAAYLMTDGSSNDIEITGAADGIFNIVSGAENIGIKNLTVKNTRGTGINIYNCSGISIEDCYVYNTGGNGLTAAASNDCTVQGSYFANNGGISVKLDGGDIPSLTSASYIVRDCEFENGARLVRTYSPFVYTSGVGFEIVNNRFYNHPHSALLFYGCENVIKNNDFEKIATETEDAAAIYSRVNPTYRGNVISNNIFRNIRSFKSEPEYADVFGVYIDDLLQDVTVSENLFVDCQNPFNFGGGRSNRFVGNAVYNTYEGGCYLTRSNAVKDSLKTNNGYMWFFTNNLRNSPGYDEAKWFARYPNYKTFVADLAKQNSDPANLDASVIKDGEIHGNVFISPNAERNKFLNVAAVVSQNGDVSNNYQSTDMTDMTVEGTAVEYAAAITQLGYSAPDVSAAGLLTAKPHKPDITDDADSAKGLSFRGIGIICDGYRTGAAPESYYDGLISYTPFGTAALTADSVGGENCLRFDHCKADFAYNNYFSYVFEPITAATQTISFETSVMLESADAANVGFMVIQGHDSANPGFSVTVAKGEYNCNTKKLMYAGGEIPLTDGEITNGFVRIMAKLDAQNSVITVYKSTDGIYDEVFEKTVPYVPEYIDRVKYSISNIQNIADAVCWFDNINVTLSKCAAAYESYGGSEIAHFGDYSKDSFCIKFTPQSGYPKLCNIVAAYSGDGTLKKVILLGTTNAVNLKKSSFGDDCYLMCFQFRSLQSCTPLGDCALIK